MNFDNATLKANSNQTGFIANVATLNLLAGGATINSNGYKIGNTGCVFFGSGGLTKIGLGWYLSIPALHQPVAFAAHLLSCTP